MDSQPSAAPHTLLTRADLKARGITFSNKHILHLERQGKFPVRAHLGPRSPVWDEAEIDAYIEKKLGERGGAGIPRIGDNAKSPMAEA